MLCSRPASLKQRAPNDLLLRHGRKPSREAGSFSGQLELSGCFAPNSVVNARQATGRKQTFLASQIDPAPKFVISSTLDRALAGFVGSVMKVTCSGSGCP